MTEINISGTPYRIGKLDAFKQFHVARRLAPIQLAMGLSAEALTKKAGEATEEQMLAAIMGPIATELAKMPQADVDYILHTCLAVCSRGDQAGAFAPVLAQNGALMFSDIGMVQMIRLTIEVIRNNLGDFFALAPGGSS